MKKFEFKPHFIPLQKGFNVEIVLCGRKVEHFNDFVEICARIEKVVNLAIENAKAAEFES